MAKEHEGKKQEIKKVHIIHGNDKTGKVIISDEVVAVIAGLAAMEVEGVSGMAGNITSEIISKLGMKNLSKGVEIEIKGNTAKVDLTVVLDYGFNIVDVSRSVQEKVKNTIETMTGLAVSAVNVKIADVDFDNER